MAKDLILTGFTAYVVRESEDLVKLCDAMPGGVVSKEVREVMQKVLDFANARVLIIEHTRGLLKETYEVSQIPGNNLLARLHGESAE